VGLGPHARGWAVVFSGDEEAGPQLVLAEVKRRTTAGGGVLLTRRFAFSVHGGRRSRSMTRGPGPPVSETGSPWRTSGDVFCGVLGRQLGESLFKKGLPRA
jgi:hypothetical protein